MSREMRADEVQQGDVYCEKNGRWMVRDVVIAPAYVKLRLSVGRTDFGRWYEYRRDEPVQIYRPEK